jgi:EAL domain-containing protein (putative c-di-GMP-specific phosphodiesterase class I)
MPLAQHLGLDVVAEGVETVEQATMLKELRCKYAQGFLFSRPVKAEDVLTMLAKSVDGVSLSPSDVALP